eukprot:g23054.t1
MDNLIVLHFCSFHPKGIKEVILHIHRICSEQEEHDIHLKVLKDAVIRPGFNAQLINRQFRRAIAKNHNNLLRRQTQDTIDRVPFVVQYFPRVEKLRHVLRSLQHIIDDNKHLAKIFHTLPVLTFKTPPNLKQTIVHSKKTSLWDSINNNTTQPYLGNLCKTCQIINLDTNIT